MFIEIGALLEQDGQDVQDNAAYSNLRGTL
jgi:hypothetical protein